MPKVVKQGPSLVEGHGRLMEPPSRSSMWRVGFKTPRNYNDNELFCGGFTRQMRNGMKCGVCGDPWDVVPPRPNEAGGKYATGQIARHYRPGQVIETAVELTANHRGHFKFRLCPVNDPKVVADDECMTKYPLEIIEASAEDPYRYYLPDRSNKYRVRVKLPSNLTCSQCVFQWTYTAGNNWGRCSDGVSRVGCGPQETFRGCSDIAIGLSHTATINNPSVQPKRHPTLVTATPWKPRLTTAYPKNNFIPPYWPRKNSTIYKVKSAAHWPQSNSVDGGAGRPRKITPHQKRWTTLLPRIPGLEKEEGLPMTPPETKMHGHYPEPTTRTPCTDPQGESSEPKNTSPRTRFSPKTAQPYWNRGTTSFSNIFRNISTKTSAESTPGNSLRPSVTSVNTTSNTAKPTSNEIESSDASSGNSNKKKRCMAIGNYAGSKKMLEWCKLNCLHEPYYCPKSHCICSYEDIP
ncbi:hypothetical protein BIW11_06818 [Tropilaelaps mercedesae]|uniref:Chitin-binding type-4 domain-containing protein n=1 Tax=Tropilaelaps mercedesae TaxID=418985 RepID=A0A1V9XWF3_9ACAR|nr:hypothetical protein BIW11_06818 [Tropilaelaps mercedesae]